jgi:AcrR family transcriptional regulator
VDDLPVEVGYAAMTMKGIAERVGVGRQTVYRWWSTKAEILFEASVIDDARELAPDPRETTAEDRPRPGRRPAGRATVLPHRQRLPGPAALTSPPGH